MSVRNGGGYTLRPINVAAVVLLSLGLGSGLAWGQTSNPYALSYPASDPYGPTTAAPQAGGSPSGQLQGQGGGAPAGADPYQGVQSPSPPGTAPQTSAPAGPDPYQGVQSPSPPGTAPQTATPAGTDPYQGVQSPQPPGIGPHEGVQPVAPPVTDSPGRYQIAPVEQRDNHQVSPPLQIYQAAKGVWLSAGPLEAAFGFEAGGTARSVTYDDGFQVKGAAPTLGVLGNLRFPVGGGWMVGPQVSLLFPFTTAAREDARTSLPLLTAIEGQVAAPMPFRLFPGQPAPMLAAGFGLAVGVGRSGASGRGFSYSDTETMTGFTGSLALEIPITQTVTASLRGRYYDLGNTTFHTPFGGHYSARENGWMGTLGLSIRFNTL